MWNVCRRGKVLVGKREGTKPIGRPRCRGEDNIKTDFQKIGWGVDWSDVTQGRNNGACCYEYDNET
jgi:hypothetical protein